MTDPLFDVIDPFDQLVQIDQRIDRLEGEALRDRWEFGRIMLAARQGKQRLSNGYLAALAERTGKSATELKYRALFAERFPSEGQLVNAVDQFGSWHQIVTVAFARPTSRPPATITPDVLRRMFNRAIDRVERVVAHTKLTDDVMAAITDFDVMVAVVHTRKMAKDLHACADEYDAIADQLERRMDDIATANGHPTT